MHSSRTDDTQFPTREALLEAYSVYRQMAGPPPGRRRASAGVAALLFVLTLLSTLAVGAQMALAYAANRAADIGDFNPYALIFRHPALLWAGLPFALTLMGILLAHELGHYFACRYYGIAASYPYFIPAPTLIGTLGAFIRIRAPIVNRRALFDVGLAGPVVGFLFAVPALMAGILTSKSVPAGTAGSSVVFGNPLLVRLLVAALRPGLNPENLLLNPIGRAAWVGLLATALNLLPAGQLDGGHIVYALAPAYHRRVSLAVVLLLLPLATLWPGWLLWAVLLLLIGFRHPPLLDPYSSLDRSRLAWAWIGLAIFLLCFTPAPFSLGR
jgi:membrane-associated protease RseP (regulator of RpoE activity)